MTTGKGIYSSAGLCWPSSGSANSLMARGLPLMFDRKDARELVLLCPVVSRCTGAS